DYIFRWLHLRFLTGQQQTLFEGLRPVVPPMLENGVTSVPPTPPIGEPLLGTGSVHAADRLKEFVDLGDAPSCHVCGAIMVRNGSCYRCMSCGATSGCS